MDVSTRAVARRAAATYFPLLVLGIIGLLILDRTQTAADRRALLEAQDETVDLAADALDRVFASARADAALAAGLDALHRWRRTSSDEDLAAVEGDWRHILEHGADPCCLRLLDGDGEERLLVRSAEDRPDEGVPRVRVTAFVPGEDGPGRARVVLELPTGRLVDVLVATVRAAPGDYGVLDGDGEWLDRPAGDGSAAASEAPPLEAVVMAGQRSGVRLDGGRRLRWRLLDVSAVVSSATSGRSPETGSARAPGALAVVGHLDRAEVEQTAGLTLGERSRALALVAIFLMAPAWLVGLYGERRARAEGELHRSMVRFRDLVESAPDAVLIVDGEGTVVLVNGQAERVFDYSRDEILGRPIEMLVPDARMEEHRALRRDYVAEPHARPMGSGQDIRGRRRDGSEVPLEVSLSPNPGGRPGEVIAIARDVTAQRAVEREVRELNADLVLQTRQLAALNQELESFNYSVSHDLRAPLRAISGFSQALLEDHADALDVTGQQYLYRVRRATRRMGELIENLLRLSRVQRADLTLIEIDLSTMAHEVVRELREVEPERTADVEIEEGLRAIGDPRLVRVVLANLLDNAWKFSQGRDTARIEFGRAEVDGEEAFYVRDDGIGFDMDQVDRLFVPFQRLHATSEHAGSGIGLATVARIVHRHQGRVWAQSTPGMGATLWFTLPALPGRDAAPRDTEDVSARTRVAQAGARGPSSAAHREDER